MPADTVQVLAFDVYGTLLDTSSISTDIRTLLHLDQEKADQLSLLWRRYQLEYTWRLNSMGHYDPFDQVTRRSFLHAAADSRLAVDEGTADRILERYSHLSPFHDAVTALQALSKQKHLKIVVFSNGTHQMIQSALAGTQLTTIPYGIFLADTMQTYKPSTTIYKDLVAHINATPNLNDGTEVPSGNVWLVSGNPFDVTGARAAGLNAIWVDRRSSGWTDRIAPVGYDWSPTKIVQSLEDIVDIFITRA
ncbi:haloacid dehalogenase [Cristinia sonorae]|uniref:Haloacid dehalogenase n=1 Tax=Cristinia sonorae TaxID=1940300 RepID=A0A8K0UK22_9AGAR|nr:haloacid dehalogenase [Cristinia sonorae]